MILTNENYRWVHKPQVDEIKYETLILVFPKYCLNLPLLINFMKQTLEADSIAKN